MPKRFKSDNVRYSMVFDNDNYALWGPQYGFLCPARIKFGKRGRNGYSKNFDVNHNAWDLLTVYNAAHDYYVYSNKSVPYPPKGLRIWVFPSKSDFSSAPMLRHYLPTINETTTFHIVSKLWIIICDISITISDGTFLSLVMPDITIGSKNKHNSIDLYSTVFHELSHASHYTNAGNSYWGRYIQYILQCNNDGNLDTYGSLNANDSGPCGVGEMWAYAMECYLTEKHYGAYSNERNTPQINDFNHAYWFKPKIVYDMIKEIDVLNPYNIITNLRSNVDSHELVAQTIASNWNDDIRAQIRNIFYRHGFDITIPLNPPPFPGTFKPFPGIINPGPIIGIWSTSDEFDD